MLDLCGAWFFPEECHARFRRAQEVCIYIVVPQGRHSREGGNPANPERLPIGSWIPAFAGMTWKWKCYFASIPKRPYGIRPQGVPRLSL